MVSKKAGFPGEEIESQTTWLHRGPCVHIWCGRLCWPAAVIHLEAVCVYARVCEREAGGLQAGRTSSEMITDEHCRGQQTIPQLSCLISGMSIWV